MTYKENITAILECYFTGFKKEIIDSACNRILEQEPKTGHWILTDDDFVYCSECEDSYYARPIDASWLFCPHCGAKMKGVEE